MPTALVTGASAGLGQTFARKLAARGYDLILVARRSDRLSDLAKQLPRRAAVLAVDLATDEGVKAVVASIHASADLELLVNNAGFGTLGRFWETDFGAQNRMHRLHVIAPLHLTNAALRDMVARGRGAVINVSSVAAFGHNPGNASYCATKAWMNAFSLALAAELRSAGSPVSVQALCPGFTETELHQTAGIPRSTVPRFLWMKPDHVVEESLRGLDRGKVLVIPNWKYKIAAAMMRHLPSSVTQKAAPRRDRVFADQDRTI